MSSIKEILHNNSGKSHFTKLVVKTTYLEKLNKVFNKILDPNFATHCFIVKLENDELSLVVDSSAWATKLRYAIPDILKNLQCQPEFKNVKKINYNVGSKVENFNISRIKKTAISEDNARLWRETLEILKNKD